MISPHKHRGRWTALAMGFFLVLLIKNQITKLTNLRREQLQFLN